MTIIQRMVMAVTLIVELRGIGYVLMMAMEGRCVVLYVEMEWSYLAVKRVMMPIPFQGMAVTRTDK